MENEIVKRKVRKWTKEENILILEYLIDSIKNGFEIEKPNSSEYYKRLSDAANLNAKPKLLKNKVRNFRNQYFQARNWENETGQGIKETEGDTTFKAVLAKKFPYYSFYEEIWGSRLNVVPPKVSEGCQRGHPDHNNSITTANQNESLLEMDFAEENILEEYDIAADIAESASSYVEDNEDLVEIIETTAAKKVVTKAVTPAIQQASKRLLVGLGKNKEVNTAKGAFEKIIKDREESLTKKLKLENEKFLFERFKFEETQKITEKRMELEFELKNKELHLRLKELEVEKLKCKALLERSQTGLNCDMI